MSKKRTPISGLNLIGNSLYELFHPKSKAKLVDYSQLDFIDFDQLNLVNFDHLKFLDLKQLNVIHFPTLVFFFQYLGALALTVFALGVMMYGYFSFMPKANAMVVDYVSQANSRVESLAGEDQSYLSETDSQYVDEEYAYVSDDEDYAYVSDDEDYYLAENPQDDMYRDLNSYDDLQEYELLAYNDYDDGVYVDVDGPEVLGSSTVAAFAAVQEDDYYFSDSNDFAVMNDVAIPQSADVSEFCSFTVKNAYYSDRSEFNLANEGDYNVCLSYDSSQVKSTYWQQVNGSRRQEINPFGSLCYKLSDLRSGDSLEVNLYDFNDLYSGTCVLNFSR